MSVKPEKTWCIIDLINWGTEFFSQHDIENARLEIEWLLSHHLGMQRVDLYVRYDHPLTPQELTGFRSLVKRRVSGEPFQYILGVAPFYGRDFKVTRDVLIPRPESEILIQVLRKGAPPTSILDIGTGSGCLAITAVLLYPEAVTLATDLSREALAVARENAETLGSPDITFQQLDILTTLPEGQFDAILCNPPYVAIEDVPGLQREIRAWEPPLAVTDQADGLTFHRRLAETGNSMLNRNGRMLIEVGGSAQAEEAQSIFTQAGGQVVLHQDLQGDDRVCEVFWRN